MRQLIDIRKTLFVNIENNIVKIIFILADLLDLFIEETVERMMRRAVFLFFEEDDIVRKNYFRKSFRIGVKASTIRTCFVSS